LPLATSGIDRADIAQAALPLATSGHAGSAAGTPTKTEGIRNPLQASQLLIQRRIIGIMTTKKRHISHK
jgi:hypothetical protein